VWETHDFSGLESCRDGDSDDKDHGHGPMNGRVVESIELKDKQATHQHPSSNLVYSPQAPFRLTTPSMINAIPPHVPKKMASQS